MVESRILLGLRPLSSLGELRSFSETPALLAEICACSPDINNQDPMRV